LVSTLTNKWVTEGIGFTKGPSPSNTDGTQRAKKASSTPGEGEDNHHRKVKSATPSMRYWAIQKK